MATSKVIIFMHIPKTAGTTLRGIIEQEYSEIAYGYGGFKEEYNNLSRYMGNRASGLQCIIGHIPFGIHSYYNRPFHYITFIREPVDRVISLYYYRLYNKKYLPVEDIGLEKFLNNYYTQACNLQTKFLSRDADLADMVSLENFIKYKNEVKPDLEKAIDNLERYFTVGVTDYFNVSILLMGRELGWNKLDYRQKNVNLGRPGKEELSTGLIELIKEKNSLDMKLYSYACNKIKSQLKDY
ncbi:sulfotransferase family 2 domain-containing protein [Halocella sp. SP3-1]|uniref:sulfotransferase family 2 domain-containing protein n=1 Tax=Halocella sp. SP3-1 TaxID=2382161 RepID=UPI000F753190|nr:sulfotransferase family 2 domain-containing protein [Halocella sp. SP3-1]AZO93205.1 hypothetical protein D7D81_00615 [Halocella sp. SP3-1]